MNLKRILLGHGLVRDLKVAAALRGYDLRIFVPDVDREGYDIVLDDGDDIMKFQVKSIYDSSTSSWKIQKGLLRPSRNLIKKLRLSPSPSTEGIKDLLVKPKGNE
jgi:hypothetical protein